MKLYVASSQPTIRPAGGLPVQLADDPRPVVADSVVVFPVADHGAVGLVRRVRLAGPPDQRVVLHGGIVQVHPGVFVDAGSK